MKIAYLSSQDPHDKRSGSGLIYYVRKALSEHVGDVVDLGPLHSRALTLGQYANDFCERTIRRSYDSDHSILLAKRFAAMARPKLRELRPDAIVAPMGSTLMAYIDEGIPILYTTDGALAVMQNYYPGIVSRLLPFSKWEGNRIERKAMHRADLLVYPSSWPADSAVNDYGVDRNRVHVVPYGANLDDDRIPTAGDILKDRSRDVCRLLFMAGHWERKGGNIVFDTFRWLKENGVKVELTVVGAAPPEGCVDEDMTWIPFLNKNDEDDFARYAELFLTSSFLFIPTRAECFGMIYPEAAAFGLPVITTDTGGVSGAITNGRNGYMLSLEAGAVEYGALVREIHEDCTRFEQLCQNSRAAYDSELNWGAWAKTVKKLLEREVAIN